MNFEPFNRHLYVLPVEEKEEEDVHRIVLPDDYMLHQINADGETIYIVLQNYVYGRIDYEDNREVT